MRTHQHDRKTLQSPDKITRAKPPHQNGPVMTRLVSKTAQHAESVFFFELMRMMIMELANPPSLLSRNLIRPARLFWLHQDLLTPLLISRAVCSIRDATSRGRRSSLPEPLNAMGKKKFRYFFVVSRFSTRRRVL